MSFFRQPRPRGFRHNFIYVDMHREEFREIENRVREKQHNVQKEGSRDHLLRGVFSGSASHLRRRNVRKQSGNFFLSSGLMIVLVLIMIVIWRILLTLW